MALILPGVTNLNPGPVTRHRKNDPRFEAFDNKELHLYILILTVFSLK